MTLVATKQDDQNSQRSRATPIGIVFSGMDDLSKEVLSHLLVYQNGIQSTFQFQILWEPEDDPFISRIASGISRFDVLTEGQSYIDRVVDFNREMAQNYDLISSIPQKIVLLTDSRLKDNYYLVGKGNWTVLAFGGWNNEFAPPSIVEYYLAHIVIAALDSLSYNERHFETRGCAFDFNASLSHTRLKVFAGKLCGDCAARLAQETSQATVDDANILLGREWLSASANPSDVSIVIKKLGYDLFRTAGFKPTLWETLKGIMAEEGVKNIVKAIVAGVAGGVVLLLGLKLPGMS